MATAATTARGQGKGKAVSFTAGIVIILKERNDSESKMITDSEVNIQLVEFMFILLLFSKVKKHALSTHPF